MDHYVINKDISMRWKDAKAGVIISKINGD